MELGRQLGRLVGKGGSYDAEISGINLSEDYQDYELNEDLELAAISINNFLIPSKDKKKNKSDNVKPRSKSTILDSMTSPKRRNKLDVSGSFEDLGGMDVSKLMDGFPDGGFDDFFDNDELLGIRENSELIGNLIGMGRKYARDNASSAESSEIIKTFAKSEKQLEVLYNEIERDKAGIQKDIDRARLPQRGTSRTLNEILNTKIGMYNAQLSIIKEGNKVKKDKLDLRNKELARKENESSNSTDINSNTLQSIFTSSRNSMMSGIGGYAAVSGSNVNEEIYDDDLIQKKYFNAVNDSDGDKFLKYEESGIEYIIEVVDGKVVEMFAADRDGNIINDYPLPTNIEDLDFDIDLNTMTARDNLYRTYKVRT